MARKPASEQQDTLEEIKLAGFYLFGRHGYDSVSISKVASAAHITKAAIYWHYEDKLALYMDCARSFYELFRGHIFTAMRAQQKPSECILALFEGTGRLLQDERIRGGVAGFWLDARGTDLSGVQALQQEFEEDARAFLASMLEQGVQEGEFTLSIPARDMATAIISLVVASVLPLRFQTPEQTRTLLRSLAHTFFRAHGSEEMAQRALLIG